MKKLNENQKKFLGTVPKKCQLVETFWDCPEISKTNNKGITLIVLIITIIVMLILVGVTINVALNGNLFGKADTAKTETNKAIEKEELTSIAIAAYDANSRSIKEADLNFNEKYTEDLEKTTTEKKVVQGPSGTLWQIDMNTAGVKEYEEQLIKAYGKNGNYFIFYKQNSLVVLSGNTYSSGESMGLEVRDGKLDLTNCSNITEELSNYDGIYVYFNSYSIPHSIITDEGLKVMRFSGSSAFELSGDILPEIEDYSIIDMEQVLSKVQ